MGEAGAHPFGGEVEGRGLAGEEDEVGEAVAHVGEGERVPRVEGHGADDRAARRDGRGAGRLAGLELAQAQRDVEGGGQQAAGGVEVEPAVEQRAAQQHPEGREADGYSCGGEGRPAVHGQRVWAGCAAGRRADLEPSIVRFDDEELKADAGIRRPGESELDCAVAEEHVCLSFPCL